MKYNILESNTSNLVIDVLEVNKKLFFECCESFLDSVEKLFFNDITFWGDLLFLKFSPNQFGNVQMRIRAAD